jgi:uncharacterized protein YqeY
MTVQAQLLFQELYHLTKTINGHIQHIDVDMDKNDDEQLEKLQDLISKRGEIIEQFAHIMQRDEVEWTTSEQEIMQEMKEWELSFQPRLEKIYKAFSSQIRKLQQGKKVSRHYHEGYGDVYSDGVYFDKRK